MADKKPLKGPTDKAPIGKRFGSNLRRARKKAGLSQEELALRCDLHRTEIGLLERGHRVPRIDTLIKIAASLETSPLDLLEGIQWRRDKDIKTGSAKAPSGGSFVVQD